MDERFETALASRAIRFQKDVPFSEMNSLHIGGTLRYVVHIETEAALVEVCAYMRDEAIPYSVIGAGKYTLVSDKGYNGVAVKLSGAFEKFAIHDRMITAGGGALIERVAREARIRNLGGLEFASSLPGSVGGCIMKNATAFGRSMSDVLHRVRIVTPGGTLEDVGDNEMAFDEKGFSLRDSIITYATFMLDADPVDDIQRTTEKYRHIRGILLPHAGSTGLIFRDPDRKKAYEMIERVGGTKLTINGAHWFKQLPNYVIVENRTTAADVYHLIMKTRKMVAEHYSDTLEISVNLLGDFD